jgi:hypothetical protein
VGQCWYKIVFWFQGNTQGLITAITCTYEDARVLQTHLAFGYENSNFLLACVGLFLIVDYTPVVKKLKFVIDFWLRPGTLPKMQK